MVFVIEGDASPVKVKRTSTKGRENFVRKLHEVKLIDLPLVL